MLNASLTYHYVPIRMSKIKMIDQGRLGDSVNYVSDS